MILSPQSRGRSTGIAEFSFTLHISPPHFRPRIRGRSVNNRRRNAVNPAFTFILKDTPHHELVGQHARLCALLIDSRLFLSPSLNFLEYLNCPLVSFVLKDSKSAKHFGVVKNLGKIIMVNASLRNYHAAPHKTITRHHAKSSPRSSRPRASISQAKPWSQPFYE